MPEKKIRPEALRDGEPCDHPGCAQHLTHPCEKCGRIAARTRPGHVGIALEDVAAAVEFLKGGGGVTDKMFEVDFKALRFDKNHHLGMGDIRLTLSQQHGLEALIKGLRTNLRVTQLRARSAEALRHNGDTAARFLARAEDAESQLHKTEENMHANAMAHRRLERKKLKAQAKVREVKAEVTRLKNKLDVADKSLAVCACRVAMALTYMDAMAEGFEAAYVLARRTSHRDAKYYRDLARATRDTIEQIRAR